MRTNNCLILPTMASYRSWGRLKNAHISSRSCGPWTVLFIILIRVFHLVMDWCLYHSESRLLLFLLVRWSINHFILGRLLLLFFLDIRCMPPLDVLFKLSSTDEFASTCSIWTAVGFLLDLGEVVLVRPYGHVVSLYIVARVEYLMLVLFFLFLLLRSRVLVIHLVNSIACILLTRSSARYSSLLDEEGGWFLSSANFFLLTSMLLIDFKFLKKVYYTRD